MQSRQFQLQYFQDLESSSNYINLLYLSLPFSLPVGTEGRTMNMENASISPGCKENAGPTNSALMQVDSAMRKSFSEHDASVVVKILQTAALEKCGPKNSDELSPSDVMLETRAPTAKTPISGGLLEKKMPFRERNMEEGRRLLPPHIKVPPKKLFGYPERYRSPTDAMVSPVSRGLLTRNRRPARTLAPMVPPKALENTFQDVVVDVAGEENGLN